MLLVPTCHTFRRSGCQNHRVTCLSSQVGNNGLVDSLPLSSVRHKPAGKVKGGASDEAGSVGSQVDQGASQVIGLA